MVSNPNLSVECSVCRERKTTAITETRVYLNVAGLKLDWTRFYSCVCPRPTPCEGTGEHQRIMGYEMSPTASCYPARENGIIAVPKKAHDVSNFFRVVL